MNKAVRDALENIWSVFVVIMVVITIIAIVKRDDMKSAAVQEYRDAFHSALTQNVAQNFPYAPQAWAAAFTTETTECFTGHFATQVQPKDFVIRRVTFGLIDDNIEKAASPSDETQRICMERGVVAAGGRAGDDVGGFLGALLE